jgi:hypothetical protein
LLHEKGLRIAATVALSLVALLPLRFVMRAGSAVRNFEIQRAMNLGLEQDCIDLLDRWPSDNTRIHRSDPEYKKLPASVRSLSPLYVTIDNESSRFLPENIGICKLGFGGFARGIRIFKSEEEAQNALTSPRAQRGKPLSKRVFLWSHQT